MPLSTASYDTIPTALETTPEAGDIDFAPTTWRIHLPKSTESCSLVNAGGAIPPTHGGPQPMHLPNQTPPAPLWPLGGRDAVQHSVLSARRAVAQRPIRVARRPRRWSVRSPPTASGRQLRTNRTPSGSRAGTSRSASWPNQPCVCQACVLGVASRLAARFCKSRSLISHEQHSERISVRPWCASSENLADGPTSNLLGPPSPRSR